MVEYVCYMWDIQELAGLFRCRCQHEKPLSHMQDRQRFEETFELLDNIYATRDDRHRTLGKGMNRSICEIGHSDEGRYPHDVHASSLKTKTVMNKFFQDPQTGKRHAMTMEDFLRGRVLYQKQIDRYHGYSAMWCGDDKR